MQQFYRIKPSAVQLTLLVCSHVLAIATVYFYLEMNLLIASGIALIALFGYCECRSMIRQEIILLELIQDQESIRIETLGQTYFYPKNKVYQTRWFAILKLFNHRKSRVLILNSDRFHSVEEYQQLRYCLSQREQSNAD